MNEYSSWITVECRRLKGRISNLETTLAGKDKWSTDQAAKIADRNTSIRSLQASLDEANRKLGVVLDQKHTPFLNYTKTMKELDEVMKSRSAAMDQIDRLTNNCAAHKKTIRQLTKESDAARWEAAANEKALMAANILNVELRDRLTAGKAVYSANSPAYPKRETVWRETYQVDAPATLTIKLETNA